MWWLAMKGEKMILPDEIQKTAINFGQNLHESSAVVAYLKAAQEVQNNHEAVALEEKLNELYKHLAAQEQAGQTLEQNELNEYYQLREQARENPLIGAREDQMQLVKLIFADAGQAMTSVLGIDFTILAL